MLFILINSHYRILLILITGILYVSGSDSIPVGRVGLSMGYSLVGWVVHGFNIILVWVWVEFGLRFMSLGWVWVEYFRVGSGMGSTLQHVQGSSVYTT